MAAVVAVIRGLAVVGVAAHLLQPLAGIGIAVLVRGGEVGGGGFVLGFGLVTHGMFLLVPCLWVSPFDIDYYTTTF